MDTRLVKLEDSHIVPQEAGLIPNQFEKFPYLWKIKMQRSMLLTN